MHSPGSNTIDGEEFVICMVCDDNRGNDDDDCKADGAVTGTVEHKQCSAGREGQDVWCMSVHPALTSILSSCIT